MTFMKANASTATGTRWRTPDHVAPSSGMCTVCLDGCLGTCEVGLSAVRGREVLYPKPFGLVTAGSEKDYPVDFSHFNISGSVQGAYGIPADPDMAIFPAVDVSKTIGDIVLKAPFVLGAQGSTHIAKANWDGYAIGAALAGVLVTVGENVCGMDSDADIRDGRVYESPELRRRVKVFQEWSNGVGGIIVQENVEDRRLGVAEYAVGNLGVEFVEIKWGQGAKGIGGEVKIHTLEHALLMKSRGYLVLPDPEDLTVQKSFKAGAFREFERHSRLGMVTEEDFHSRVEALRRAGAKYVSLKTGAYRPADLALAVKVASEARIDLLVVDGAGGGTGMSPWRMMNEWGIPTVYLESLLVSYLNRLASQGRHLPNVAIAGGIALEDQIFKALAMGAPYVSMVGLGRAPMAAAMVGKTVGNLLKKGRLPRDLEIFGSEVDLVFSCAAGLKEEIGSEAFSRLPPSALGVYSYLDRVVTGLKQLMAGARKFSLNHISRADIFALTSEASLVTGIPLVTEADKQRVEEILASVSSPGHSKVVLGG